MSQTDKKNDNRDRDTTVAVDQSKQESDAPVTPTDTKEERFLAEQKAEAQTQNLRGDHAVPEQRPQGFMKPPSSGQSAVEAESTPPEHPPLEGYERANSDSQRAKAEKGERTPRFLHGQTVRIVNHENELMNGRKGVIVSIAFTDRGARDARSGDPVLHNFAEVATYIVNTRDEGPHRVECTPDQVEAIDATTLSGRDIHMNRI